MVKESPTRRYERLRAEAAGRVSTTRLIHRAMVLPRDDSRQRVINYELDARLGEAWWDTAVLDALGHVPAWMRS